MTTTNTNGLLSAPAADAIAPRDWTVPAFRWFVVAHLVVWTLIPTFTKPNPPLDMVEMVFWGHEWRISYTKHPPLPSWIDETVAVASGGSLWAQYLVTQAAVVVAFWAVWRLARELVAPELALMSVCLMECCPFFNFGSESLNNNVGLYPCWAMTVLMLFRAMHSQRLRPWLAVGLWLGLGMLTKYTTIMLAATVLGFGLVHPQARKAWRRPGPYLAILVAILVFLPHAWWVAAHGFTPLQYAASHVAQEDQELNRWLNPLSFLVFQLGMLAPVALAAIPILGYRWRWRKIPPEQQFDRTLLATMVLGPLALHLTAPLVLNLQLRGVYGSQLWMFAGLLMFLCFETRPLSAKAWATCAAVVAVLAIGSSVISIASPYIRHKPSRHLFPGTALVAEVDRAWRTRYARPLPIVAGDYYVAGTVAFFDADRPRVFQSMDESISDIGIHNCPWLSDDEFRRQGGVILWDCRIHPDGLPGEVVRRFGITESLELPPLPYQTSAWVPPARIGMAIVPPGNPALKNTHP